MTGITKSIVAVSARTRALLAAACVVLGLSSCLKLTENQNGNLVALIQMNARTKGAGFTTAPTANFYRAGSVTLSNAAFTTDSCQVGLYDPSTSNTADATVISGGASVAMTVSGLSDTLRNGGTGTYRLSTSAGLTFTPGDSASFTIAGDASGFPATSTIVKTAEPFTMSAITLPAANQPINVTWSPAASGSAMLVVLLFNDGSNATSSVPNRQVFCSWIDDGAQSIPATVVDSWRLGSAAARTVITERLRTSTRQLAGTNAYVNVISLFELPVPVSP